MIDRPPGGTGETGMSPTGLQDRVIFAAPFYEKKDNVRGISYGLVLIAMDRMILVPVPFIHVSGPDVKDTSHDRTRAKPEPSRTPSRTGIPAGWNPWGYAPMNTWTVMPVKSFIRKKMHGYYRLRISGKSLSHGYALIPVPHAGSRSFLRSILSNRPGHGTAWITS